MDLLQIKTIEDDDQISVYDSDEEQPNLEHTNSTAAAEKSTSTSNGKKKNQKQQQQRSSQHTKKKSTSEMNKSFTFEADGGDLPVHKGWQFSQILEKFGKKNEMKRKTVDQHIQDMLGEMSGSDSDSNDGEEFDGCDKAVPEMMSHDNDEDTPGDDDDEINMSSDTESENDNSKKNKIKKSAGHDMSTQQEDIVKEKRKAAYFAPVVQVEEVQVAESFLEMRLSRSILKAVAALGYIQPTHIQSKAIPLAMRGLDICGAAETGSGKTAAFIIPILERLMYRPKSVPATRVLILVPTRELAVQCLSVAQNLSKFTDITFALCVGGLNTKVQEQDLRKRPDVVIATPGRLIDHIKNAPNFNLDTIDILIIDEADRILEDGFAAELNEIIKYTPKNRQTMLFSATMTDNIDDLIRLSLNRPVRLFVDHNMSLTSRLTQEFLRVRNPTDELKTAMLLAICCRTYTSDAIIFFKSKAQAHYMKILFGLMKFKAAELHGNLTQLQRLEALEQFKTKQVDFLLATDLASRGLDIQGIRTVINFDMPQNYPHYVHRVGRTARGGQSGVALSFITEQDRKILKMALKNTNDEVKNRVIPAAVIQKYEQKLNSLKDAVMEVMIQEKHEKEIAHAEMQVMKMQNMVEHEHEIKSRPKREWFQTTDEKTTSKNIALAEHKAKMGILDQIEKNVEKKQKLKRSKLDGLSRKKKRNVMSREEDEKMAKKQKLIAKSAKKSHKLTKLTQLQASNASTVSSARGKTSKKSGSFDREMRK